MKIRHYLFFLLLTLCTITTRAQHTTAWVYGFKLGLGNSGVSYANVFEDAAIVPVVALYGGFHPTISAIGVYTDLQYEQRLSTSFAFDTDTKLHYLTVPLYLRFGKPSTRFHVAVGGFYGQCLNNPPARVSTYRWALHRQEWGGMVGVDARLISGPAYDLLLGFSGRWGLTPMFNPENPRYGGPAKSRLYALTLTSNFHFGNK